MRKDIEMEKIARTGIKRVRTIPAKATAPEVVELEFTVLLSSK